MPELAPEQAALADRDDLLAAAREGAHDRGARRRRRSRRRRRRPPEMRPSTMDAAQGAGVEVDEALVHHGRALGEVGAEADPVGVADPDPGRHDVVDHPRELVDAVDRHVLAGGLQPGPGQLEAGDRARPGRGPHDVGEQAEDARRARARAAGTRRWLRRCSRSQASSVVVGAAARSAISTRRTSRVTPRASSGVARDGQLGRASRPRWRQDRVGEPGVEDASPRCRG